MIKIFEIRNKINNLKNTYKFSNNESIFTSLLDQSNVQIDRQNLNCRTVTLLTTVSL